MQAHSTLVGRKSSGLRDELGRARPLSKRTGDLGLMVTERAAIGSAFGVAARLESACELFVTTFEG